VWLLEKTRSGYESIEWKRTLDDIAVKLFPFSFSLAVRHAAFTTLTDLAVHVLGQF